MRITKPIEELTGTNYGITRQKLGRIHCCTPLKQAIREEFAPIYAQRATMPPELYRGFLLCVIETLAEYRGTFTAVTTGNLS